MTRNETEVLLIQSAEKNGRIAYRSRYEDSNGDRLWCTQDRIGTDARTGTLEELLEWETGYTGNQSRERARGFAHPVAKADGCAVRRTRDRHSGPRARRGS